ncbi:MAG: hypothetical protein JSS02_31550 [Planctomycetes bacterium]|nr:hypothetical protein [Planctomycetota bacterium]
MARMKRGDRTQAVRDYLAEHPDATPKSVVAGLAEKGIKVKVTLVNSIKYKKPSGSVAGSSRVRAIAGGSLGFEHLLEVKRLADAMGGTEQVRQALDALSQLR